MPGSRTAKKPVKKDSRMKYKYVETGKITPINANKYSFPNYKSNNLEKGNIFFTSVGTPRARKTTLSNENSLMNDPLAHQINLRVLTQNLQLPLSSNSRITRRVFEKKPITNSAQRPITPNNVNKFFLNIAKKKGIM